jgi:hypothetical protein
MPKKTRQLSIEGVGRGQRCRAYNPIHQNHRLLSTREEKRKQERQKNKSISIKI